VPLTQVNDKPLKVGAADQQGSGKGRRCGVPVSSECFPRLPIPLHGLRRDVLEVGFLADELGEKVSSVDMETAGHFPT